MIVLVFVTLEVRPIQDDDNPKSRNVRGNKKNLLASRKIKKQFHSYRKECTHHEFL